MEEINSKEVNLLQLITLFFNWLKKIGKSILNFIGYLARLSFRHKIIVIASILVCLSISYYLSRPSARIYKAEAVAMLYGVETQTAKEISKQLETSVSSNTLYSLSSKLSLPDSITKNIIEINSFYVIDYLKDGVADIVDYKNNHSLTDTLNLRMKDRFCLQIKFKNMNQVPVIQAAILNYFNNNEVMKKQFNIRKSEIIKQINICDIELQRIDSLAKISYFKDTDKQLRFDKDKLLIGEQKKQLFFDDLLRLHDIKAYSEYRLTDFTQPMILPSGFVVSPNPENGRLKLEILGVFFGLLIGMFISGLIESFNKIIAFLNNK